MSEAAAIDAKASPFSPKTILALVMVGVFAFSGFVVLLAYAPDFRGRADPGGHALSSSAIGFAGAEALLRGAGVTVGISRARPQKRHPPGVLLVLTPPVGASGKDLAAFGLNGPGPTLVVLPKWSAVESPLRPGWVMKAGVIPAPMAQDLLKGIGPPVTIQRRAGVSAPRLKGGDYLFTTATSIGLDRIDRLQTLSGKGWIPVLTDENGAMVLAAATDRPLFVLADPDLLNTQGLAGLGNSWAALSIVQAIRPQDGVVVFDVALAGFQQSRDLLRVALEPPALGATLCVVAAVLLLGFHALVRFGPAADEARAFALGPRVLVENSAGLVRMARREHELAEAYAELTAAEAARAAGVERSLTGSALVERLDRLGLSRGGASSLRDLGDEAAKTTKAGRPADLLAVARRLYEWKREMTRDRR